VVHLFRFTGLDCDFEDTYVVVFKKYFVVVGRCDNSV